LLIAPAVAAVFMGGAETPHIFFAVQRRFVCGDPCIIIGNTSIDGIQAWHNV
jgi:hypothetical protein